MELPLSVLEQIAMKIDLIEMSHCDEPHFFFQGGYANIHEATLINRLKVALKTERYQDGGSIMASDSDHVRQADTDITLAAHPFRSSRLVQTPPREHRSFARFRHHI